MSITQSKTWDENRIARVCLASFPGFGSRSLRKLRANFENGKSAWTAPMKKLKHAGIPEKVLVKFLEWRREVDPRAFIRALDQEGIDVVFPEETKFPAALTACADPPEILFVRGELHDVPMIAFVGTRRPTSYGKECTDALVRGVVQSGLGIVSGLALGIDGIAHETTIRSQGYTIAVLGTGVDEASLYPREHVKLAHRILDAGGAVLSEFPPGADSRKEHFPMRNRIIAGLALATVVIEAAEKSGSLITAKSALEENREVLAVPGPIWSDQSKGTNTLIKLGAKPCTGSADILEALALDRPEVVVRARAHLPLVPEESLILDQLDEPTHVDAIAEALQKDAATIAAVLSMLELKGLIKSIGGQMWIRAHHERID